MVRNETWHRGKTGSDQMLRQNLPRRCVARANAFAHNDRGFLKSLVTWLAAGAVLVAIDALRLKAENGKKVENQGGVKQQAAIEPQSLERDFEADARLAKALGNRSPELIQMVPIEGGTYTMGDPLSSGLVAWTLSLTTGNPTYRDRVQEHEESVESFYLGKYEVTVEQFVYFLNAIERKDERHLYLISGSPVRFRGGQWSYEVGAEHLAVDTVTWHGANAFCEWLSDETGDSFRLPTEAEWEFAAKGKEGRLYPWGVTLQEYPLDEDGQAKLDAEVRKRADWGGNLSPKPGRRPVGSFPQGSTPEGVCDMVGGVWEWCNDWSSPLRSRKVLRGGRENAGSPTMTSTRLSESPKGRRDAHIYGMRLVREPRPKRQGAAPQVPLRP